MSNKSLALLGYLVAIVLAIVAIVYFITPANHLPHYFPGYEASATKTHFKHGLAAALLALGALAFAWFRGGPKSASDSQSQSTQ